MFVLFLRIAIRRASTGNNIGRTHHGALRFACFMALLLCSCNLLPCNRSLPIVDSGLSCWRSAPQFMILNQSYLCFACSQGTMVIGFLHKRSCPVVRWVIFDSLLLRVLHMHLRGAKVNETKSIPTRGLSGSVPSRLGSLLTWTECVPALLATILIPSELGSLTV
jgi:hypothetical protein